MLYRKFALVAGVLALAMVPSAVRAEYMQITFQEINSSGTVVAAASVSDLGGTDSSQWASYGNTSGESVYSNPAASSKGYTVYENGNGTYASHQTGSSYANNAVIFTFSNGTYSMTGNQIGVGGTINSTTFKPDFVVTVTGSTSNSPGTASQGLLQLTSMTVKNESGSSDTLLITVTSGDYTQPQNKVYLSQNGFITAGSNSTLSNLTATSYLDTANTNYAALNSNNTTLANGSPSSSSTTIATPTSSIASISNGAQWNIPYQNNGTTYLSNLSGSYSLTSTEEATFASGATATEDPNVLTSAPEPSTLVLAFLGLSCVGGQRLLSRRKKQAVAV